MVGNPFRASVSRGTLPRAPGSRKRNRPDFRPDSPRARRNHTAGAKIAQGEKPGILPAKVTFPVGSGWAKVPAPDRVRAAPGFTDDPPPGRDLVVPPLLDVPGP